MKYFKKLVGDRIYLSPRNSEDVEIFTEWLNDFGITDYIGRSAAVMTLDAERKYLQNPDHDSVGFAIIDLKTDEMIGTVSIEDIKATNRTGLLGIFIGNEKYRNNGYGTEAIKLILDFAFNYLNLNSIRLDVFSCNERAIKCYEKCGFKKAGVWRKSKYINGKYYDTISMDILAEEFVESFIKNKEVK